MKAISAIRYRAKIIATRLPDIDRWIAARRLTSFFSVKARAHHGLACLGLSGS